MIPGLIVVLAVAVVDWIAVAKGWRKVEIITKPLTMAGLFLTFALVGRFSSLPLIFFGVGILFSLLGDIFLLLRAPRWFVIGLVSFLLTHIAYIIGFNLPLPNISPVWAVGAAIVLALSAGRIIKRIITGLTGKGLQRLAAPVMLYGTILTIMLLSGLLTLFRVEWNAYAALLAAIGAFLFAASDTMLAWNKFVSPAQKSRLTVMITYHLGQILLIAGVLIQFTK
jgi:uncharacterized membrane protein YhhN